MFSDSFYNMNHTKHEHMYYSIVTVHKQYSSSSSSSSKYVLTTIPNYYYTTTSATVLITTPLNWNESAYYYDY